MSLQQPITSTQYAAKYNHCILARPWLKAFPEYPRWEMPLIPRHWVDLSWKNDACPHFVAAEYKSPNKGVWTISIWVDRLKPADREWDTDHPRFHAYWSLDNGACEIWSPVIYEGDNWDDLLEAVEAASATNPFELYSGRT